MDEKEIQMDVAPQEGSGRRRARKSRRATRTDEPKIHKEPHDNHPSSSHPSSSHPSHPSPPSSHSSHSSSHPPPTKPTVPAKVVIAPPKKRPTKVLLVPKTVKIAISAKKKAIAKTFKAKRVRLTIDNSSKTRKRRSTLVSSVDALTDDQIRAAAVKAKLSNRESVNKAPIALLKQMVKDYQIMKGMLL